MAHPAVFLDRDGTIIEDRGYVRNREDVRLLPGAAEAVARLRRAGFRVVIVSNQSGVARGLFDEAGLAAVHDRLEELLREAGTRLDGAYYCPFLSGPEAKVEAYRRDSELRKPRPGMLLAAARELDLDLARSWMIGDSAADAEAGRAAGCRTILLRPNGRGKYARESAQTLRVDNLAAAAELVVRSMSDQSSERSGDRPPDRGAPASRDEQVLAALERIHDQLERAHRQQRQADFSVWRLFGALLQMFALVAALWGVVPLLNDQATLATARLLLACFFQLAAVTALFIDRFR